MNTMENRKLSFYMGAVLVLLVGTNSWITLCPCPVITVMNWKRYWITTGRIN